MDKLSAQQRHANMAAIRSKDTKPEMIVRRGLWKRGFRYRLNHKRLPGHPDLVLRKYRTCIWECELKPSKREETLESIAFTLNHIWLKDHGAKAVPYPKVDEESENYLKAAEEEI
jgi:DNA mismatch endonuclease (patch repair protein)